MLSRLLTAFIGRQPPKKSRRLKQVSARRAFFEALEGRQLLAVTSIQALDDVAPVVGSFQAATVTNDNRLSISINTPHPFALADITIYRNDGALLPVQQLENVPTDAGGRARVTTPVLADGNYLIRARAGLYAKYFFICDPGLAEFEAEGSLTFRVDASRPVPTVSSPVLGPTNSAEPLPFIVRFSEPVQGFQASDAVVANGTIERMVANSPSSFTFFVRPTSAGDVSLGIPAGVAVDAASNPNTASNRLAITFDPTAPALISVTRQPVSNGITNADSLVFRTTFSEPIINVDATDFAAVGTTAVFTDAIQINPRVFDLTLSGGDLAGLNGVVKLAVRPGNNVSDVAGTGLTAQTPAVDQRYFLDNTRPAVRISTTVSSPTNATSIPIRAVFSEAVVGLTQSDILVTNGTVTGLSGSGRVYTFTVEPTADGVVILRLPSAIAHDAAGNNNFASNSLSIASDSTAPGAVVSSTSANPTNSSAIPFRVTFQQTVTGFTAGDPIITNGTITGFTGSGNTYRFQVIPTSDGPVSVRVPAGVAQDLAGNDNLASGVVSIISDRAPPSTILSTSINSPTNDALIPIRLQFSEGVSGLTLSDILVANGTASDLTGSGNSYRFNITPSADGLVTIRIPKGVVRDAATNANTAATPLSILSDRARPSATIASSSASPTNAAEIPFRITFSEAVTGFAAGDIQIVNGTLSSITGSGTTYDILVTPTADGLVTVKVAGGVAKDAAGNGNLAATPMSIRSDRTAPMVDVSSSLRSPTNADVIPFKIVFSEPVIGFALGDILLVNGGIMDFITNADGSFTVNVIPNGDGQVRLRVPAGSARDSAGNDNTVGSFTVISDRTSPRATLTYNAPPNGSALLGTVTITFTEPVTGLDINDLQLRFAGEVLLPLTALMLSGSGATYTLDLSKLGMQPGNYELTLTAAGSDIFDLAGNPLLLDATTTWAPTFGNP
jgi:hypothetical protein